MFRQCHTINTCICCALAFVCPPEHKLFFPVDILSNVTVLNSTAITVYWSTKPKIGLVQCCPDGKSCLTATVKDTDLDNYVYPGLEEYTRYAVSLRGESREVFIITYQDSKEAVCVYIHLVMSLCIMTTTELFCFL